MHKYLIERTVAGAGQMDATALAAIASESNKVLRDLGPDVQWVHSYVTRRQDHLRLPGRL